MITIHCDCGAYYEIEGSPLPRINDIAIQSAQCPFCKRQRNPGFVRFITDPRYFHCEKCGIPMGLRKGGRQPKLCHTDYMIIYRARQREKRKSLTDSV